MNKTTIVNLINKKCETIQNEIAVLAAQIATNETEFPTNELTEGNGLSFSPSNTDHFLNVIRQDYYHSIAQYALAFRKIIPSVKKYLVTDSTGSEYDDCLERLLVSIFAAYNDWYGTSTIANEKNVFDYDDLGKNPNFGKITEIMELYDAFKEICNTKNIGVVEAVFYILYTGTLESYMVAYESQIPKFVFEMEIESLKKELDFLSYIEGLISKFGG